MRSDDPTALDQLVLFVDVSRMSTADILTIHDKIAPIMRLLTPGRPECPLHAIASRDQPTNRMLVRIWKTFSLEVRRSTGSLSVQELRIHKLRIPFPGFFHIEKHSLYPLCKEMLHSMGLRELARCGGLSDSQIDNLF